MNFLPLRVKPGAQLHGVYRGKTWSGSDTYRGAIDLRAAAGNQTVSHAVN